MSVDSENLINLFFEIVKVTFNFEFFYIFMGMLLAFTLSVVVLKQVIIR